MIKLTKNISELQGYLREIGVLKESQEVNSVSVPGEGNMNFTLRVTTKNGETFIVKQSRDYVEKYPDVPAPADRCLREGEFYNAIKDNKELSDQTPNVLFVDEKSHVLIMEDLGEGTDYTYLYKNDAKLESNDVTDIIGFLASLHTSIHAESSDNIITNRKMRKLNHEHMYVYPFIEENGLNLNDVLPGLAEIAKPYQQNDPLRKKVSIIGERYLKDGNVLLHGDYFPGSWLRTGNGLFIIDPEFCFYGEPEFDLGVCIAHMQLADQPEEIIEELIVAYKSKAKINQDIMEQYAAVEIMRRIMGLAQLPLEINLDKRAKLLASAYKIIMQ